MYRRRTSYMCKWIDILTNMKLVKELWEMEKDNDK